MGTDKSKPVCPLHCWPVENSPSVVCQDAWPYEAVLGRMLADVNKSASIYSREGGGGKWYIYFVFDVKQWEGGWFPRKSVKTKSKVHNLWFTHRLRQWAVWCSVLPQVVGKHALLSQRQRRGLGFQWQMGKLACSQSAAASVVLVFLCLLNQTAQGFQSHLLCCSLISGRHLQAVYLTVCQRGPGVLLYPSLLSWLMSDPEEVTNLWQPSCTCIYSKLLKNKQEKNKTILSLRISQKVCKSHSYFLLKSI